MRARFDEGGRPGHNGGVHMTRPDFGIVIHQCSFAIVGELYMETIA
jgi:hypothetical protein